MMSTKKYMLLFGGALVFLVFVIGILSVTFNYVRLNREWALREFEQDIKAGSQQLQFFLESLRSDLLRIDKYLANNNMKIGEELYGYLDFVMGHHKNAITEILILDVNGKLLAGTNPTSAQSNFQESKYFKDTQHIPNIVYLSEAIIISDLLKRSEGAPEIFKDPLDLGFVLHTGVYSKGIFKGAVLFVVRIEPFFNRYSMALTKLTSGYGFILQENGRILFHRDVELRGKFLSDLPDSSDLAGANELLKKTEGKISGYRALRQHMIISSEIYMENQRWILGISTTPSKLTQKALTTIYILSGLLLLLGIIIFGLVFSLIRLGRAKESLRDSEIRFRSIFESAENVSLIMTDLAGKEAHILEFSPGAERIFGYSREEVIGKPVAMLHLQEDMDRFPEVIEAMGQEREGFTGESTLIRKSGERFPVLFTTHPIFDAQGNMTASLSVSIDITDLKRAEEALIKSEKQLRIQNQIAHIFLTKTDDKMYGEVLNILLDATQSKYGVFGYIDNKGALVCPSMTKDIWDQCQIADKDIVFPEETWGDSIWGNGLRTKKSAYSNKPFKVPEGHIPIDRGLTVPLVSGDKSIGLFMVANKGTDYTEIDRQTLEVIAEQVVPVLKARLEGKRSEDALRESEEKYRSIMESMKEPVYICSSDYRVEYMNKAMVRRTGHDATGEICYKVIHEQGKKCSWCFYDRVQHGEHVIGEIISPKDNRIYNVSHSPIYHIDGSISKLSIFRDISDLKKMETQLQQAQKMEAIGTLAGGVAHDFNNVLSPIIGYAEMTIIDAPENSTVRKNLNEILRSALRARDLVQQILTFSRQQDQELKPLKVQIAVREALKLIRSSLPTTIGIIQNIEEDCGLVMADPTQIHQIVMNLCTNAYHAMDETGGTLEVNLKEVELTVYDLTGLDMEPGPYLCLKVSDTGHGMEQSVVERIFDPYFTTKEKDRGTGLGLAVVHGIVKSYKGDIKVYSELGKGTVFHVYLPRIKGADVSPESVPAKALPTGHESVLLVDDEEQIVSLEKQMLERLGYHVTARTSSIDALEEFREQPDKFDIVITDMTMPNMTGVRLAADLIKIRPDIPIAICTGFSEKISREKAYVLGIKAFLTKPIVMLELATTIRKILDEN
jgi:PAS domain S-box-containing protein